jgi:hypothetical protein
MTVEEVVREYKDMIITDKLSIGVVMDRTTGEVESVRVFFSAAKKEALVEGRVLCSLPI